MDSTVVMTTLVRTVCEGCGGSLVGVGARDSRRIESEAGEYNTSFKNLRCLGKRRTWAVAGGGVTSRKFFFKSSPEDTFINFRETGREGERGKEREKPVSAPSGDQTHNLGLCLD